MFRKLGSTALYTGSMCLFTYGLSKMNDERLNLEYTALKKKYPNEEPALKYHHLGMYGGYHEYHRQQNRGEYQPLSLRRE